MSLVIDHLAPNPFGLLVPRPLVQPPGCCPDCPDCPEGLGCEALPEASRGLLSVLSPSVLSPQSFLDPGHGDEKQQAFSGFLLINWGTLKYFKRFFF